METPSFSCSRPAHHSEPPIPRACLTSERLGRGQAARVQSLHIARCWTLLPLRVGGAGPGRVDRRGLRMNATGGADLRQWVARSASLLPGAARAGGRSRRQQDAMLPHRQLPCTVPVPRLAGGRAGVSAYDKRLVGEHSRLEAPRWVLAAPRSKGRLMHGCRPLLPCCLVLPTFSLQNMAVFRLLVCIRPQLMLRLGMVALLVPRVRDLP